MSSAMTINYDAMALLLNDDDRWAAIEKRDRRADGIFYYSVRTTGVYCRPSCASRLAGACASNIIAVAIPCHRVLRNDGSLSGYRWGVERKRRLLDRETK